MSSEVRGNLPARKSDVAMYASEPMPFDVKEGPRVTLLSMNADPLGDIAAMCMMYEGKVVRGLSLVDNQDRLKYFQQVMRTHLKAPLEAVNFHFMIEGVTRAFTHQMVRQRMACFAQESLRFAVKDNLDEETPLPPSLAGLKEDDPRVVVWRKTINSIQDGYSALVEAGIPAEDARGLLPHQTTTRLHYLTNLRSLLEHGGNRLCTQAQFEWRAVFTRIIEAIQNYDRSASNGWQFQELAGIFRPICYLTGKCEFKATFDRACSIRERVDAFASEGVPSAQWYGGTDTIPGIHPAEWLRDPMAARVSE